MSAMQRQKLFEAMAFFQKNTKNCGLVKTFKLLYFLDMLHFRETGRSVTGLDYKALPYGPVPTTLYDELKNPGGDLAEAFSITFPPASEASALPPPTQIKARHKIEPEALTRRELRIAAEVAEIFHDVGANDISEVSHKRNGPWDKARIAGAGKWGIPINFLDAANLRMGSRAKVDVSRDELAERSDEHAEVRRAFG
jgi:uncharacterized phage-associated protein